MLKCVATIFVILFVMTTKAIAVPMPVQNNIVDAQEVGHGTLTYYFWDVYIATLWAPNGTWNPDQPYALTLDYLRKIDGEEIADRSAQEMRHIGMNDELTIAAWYRIMRDIFPSVKKGTKLTGIYLPNKGTLFFEGDKPIGNVTDQEFSKWFFGIWLHEKTSIPVLRSKLLGIDNE